MKRLPSWLPYLALSWAALFGVWLVLVDSLAHPEVAAGPLAATLAVLVALGLRRVDGRRFRFRLRWLAYLRPTPLSVLRDTGTLFAALWRRLVRGEPPQGTFRLLRFTTSAEHDPDAEAAAWRAFCAAATSLAPNTYVIGIDREQRTILVHQLVPDSPEQLRRAVIGSSSHEDNA